MLFLMQLFTAWIVVCLIWRWVALCIAVLYPLVDGGVKKIWIVFRGTKHIVENKISGDNSVSSAPADKEKEEISASGKGNV